MKFPHFRCSPARAAFSLVEVAIALGIFSFSILGLLGLLPIAVSIHGDAKSSTVLSQIKQRLAADVLLTDGANLSGLVGVARNFDAEGREVGVDEADKAVYRARIEIENFQPPGAPGTSSSLQRVVLFAVQDPTPAGTLISAAKPSGSLLVSKAEFASAVQ